MVALIKPAHSDYRIAAVVGVLAALAVVWAPFTGTGRSPLLGGLVIAAGCGLSPLVCALILGTSYISAVTSGLVIAGFFLFLCGLSTAILEVARSETLAVISAGAVGTLAVASFHLGDPILEWGGAGLPSHAAITILHWVNPLGGAVGDGLGIDWLRLPIMYSGFPGSTGGGLSAAQYYDWAYPTFWVQATIFGVLGLILMVVADRLAIRFPPRPGGS